MNDAIKRTVVILGTGATMGSGYTRHGKMLPGDRGFFGNSIVKTMLQSGHFAAVNSVLDSFRRGLGGSLDTVGLEEVWTFLEFAGKGLFRNSVDFKDETARWLEAVRRPESRLDDEHCLCRRYRADRTLLTRADVDLLLVAGWDLRRLLGRVFDELTPPDLNVYAALLKKYDITCDSTTRTIIININYDTVLEDALSKNGTPWYYGHVHTTIQRDPSSLRILKPHGSLNWRFRGNEPSVEITADYSLAPVDCRSESDNRFEEAMIIPPTQIKQAITVAETQNPATNKLFTAIWHDMIEALARASRVFVIGYSFPPTDLHLRTGFHLASYKRQFKPIDEVYCCTKADGGEREVFANAKRFLPLAVLSLSSSRFRELCVGVSSMSNRFSNCPVFVNESGDHGLDII